MAAPVVSRKRERAHVAAATRKRARFTFSNITDYQLLEEIGRGAHGVVFKARRGGTGETVAVKRIRGGDAGLRAAAVREISCLLAVGGHPSVVKIKGAADDEATGDVFVVMELGGPSLRSRMTTTTLPLPEDETRAYMRQLLRAAERAHGVGLVHGDINPDNILVGADGALKLCGFSCASPARSLGSVCPEERLGTMRYRSPELLNCSCFFRGQAADMFALGCVMYELVTGSPLFMSHTEEDLLEEAEELHDALIELEEGYDGLDLGELSLPGQKVLAGLLQFHDNERLTAADALKLPWFTEEEDEPEGPSRH